MRNKFLWDGNSSNKKFHLVWWQVVTSGKEGGGLGIRNLRLHNKSMLFKWLWRILRNERVVWIKIIEPIYGSRQGWNPPSHIHTLEGEYGKGFVNYGPSFNNSPNWRWGMDQKLDFGLTYEKVMSAWNKDILFFSVVAITKKELWLIFIPTWDGRWILEGIRMIGKVTTFSISPSTVWRTKAPIKYKGSLFWLDCSMSLPYSG